MKIGEPSERGDAQIRTPVYQLLVHCTDYVALGTVTSVVLGVNLFIGFSMRMCSIYVKKECCSWRSRKQRPKV